jgi:hypothetical protein
MDAVADRTLTKHPMLQQVLPIENISIQRKRIHSVDTSQVGAKMAGLAGGFMKRVYAAVLAKIMFGGFSTELIKP